MFSKMTSLARIASISADGTEDVDTDPKSLKNVNVNEKRGMM